METPLDVLSRAASLVHADDEKRKSSHRPLLCLFVVSLEMCVGENGVRERKRG